LIGCVGAVVAVTGVALALVLGGATSETASLGSSDLAAIGKLAVSYCDAQAIQVVVPAQFQGDVAAELDAIVAAKSQPVQFGDSHASVLDDEAKQEIDAEYRAAMSGILTPEYLAATVDKQAAAGQSAGEMLDLALYNNPEAEPLLKEVNKLGDYLECKAEKGSGFVVWAQVWTQDVDATGPRIEAWPIYEFTVVKGETGWQIDDARVIWMCLDADRSAWGPDSPHDSISEGEPAAESTLYPGMDLTPKYF